MGERGACTLLGPEGPGVILRDRSCSSAFMRSPFGGGLGDRPYFENYTVDASIFSMTLFGVVLF